MKKRFLKVAQDSHFFDKHQRVLVALSGGIDSMNLFLLLYHHREKFGIELGIAHVNHQQRAEAVDEEKYLRKMAQKYEIPFYCSHFTGVFSENTAREWRYQFFTEIMLRNNYTCLVTGHHADDQAETVLMRLIRGSRLRHLSGMKSVQSFASGELIRPLLSFSKKELEDYFHFEDDSNTCPAYFRNRVRQTYLPQFQKENPNITSALNQLADESQLFVQALNDLTKHIEPTQLEVFKKQTEAVQSFLLQNYLERFTDLKLSKSQFSQVLHILQTKANYLQPLKNGYLLEKDYQTFKIYKIQPETDRQTEEVVIKSEGIFDYGSYIFSLGQPIKNAEQVLHFPVDSPIILRRRKNGDRILINGIFKKLRRLFIDNKISQRNRDEAVIIEQNSTIYGIATIATSDLSKFLKNDIIKATLYIKIKE